MVEARVLGGWVAVVPSLADACPHWPDGKHGDMRCTSGRWPRKRVVSICVGCDRRVPVDDA